MPIYEDLFEKYLNNETGNTAHRCRALTARSYKNIDHSLSDQDDNDELATYGDALLKHALCELLFDNVKNITVEKQDYESDEVLVKVIARNYDLLDHMRFDKNDPKIPKDYNYYKKEDRDDNSKSPHKYIATAAEALLAAIYLDHGCDMNCVREIVARWKQLIDQAKVKKGNA